MSERTRVQREIRTVGRRRRERGQSLVETAIVFPILLLLLAAVVDFGRAFDAYIVLTNAAREGARYGAIHPSTPVLHRPEGLCPIPGTASVVSAGQGQSSASMNDRISRS